MKLYKLLNAVAFTLIFTAASSYAVDSVNQQIANDRARAAAAADRIESAYDAARPGAAATIDRAAADARLAADRADSVFAADRARVDSSLDRAARETDYAATRAAAATETAARSIVPWIIGIALLAAILYWVSRLRRTTYVPPVDRVDRDATVPPVGRNGTGIYS